MGISGNLKTMELAELLQWLSQGYKTGTLVIDNATVEKRIFFQEGKIISAASSDPKEHLGHFLVSHGFISEEQLAEAVRRQERTKSMIGKCLVEMDAITGEQLDYMLRLKAEEGIYSLFEWKEGEFRFLDGQLPAYQMVPISLDVTGIILEASRRLDEWSRIKLRIPSPSCVPVRIVEDLENSPDLEESQRYIMSAVDDNRSIDEIALQTHASEYYVCETLYPLVMSKKIKIVKPRGGSSGGPQTGPIDIGTVSGDALLKRGLKHLADGDLAAALRYVRAARNLDPDNGAVQNAAEQAEKAIRDQVQSEGILPNAVPQLAIRIEEVMQRKVSAKAGFLISRINGSYDIAAILKISPMNPLEAQLEFRELVRNGLIKLIRK